MAKLADALDLKSNEIFSRTSSSLVRGIHALFFFFSLCFYNAYRGELYSLHHRSVAQLVEQRSPKPLVVGSSPARSVKIYRRYFVLIDSNKNRGRAGMSLAIA